ncbi:MAG: 50S ribosomal protein L21e [Thermoprotei archaeon]|nr:MAG: 50S ribosomal protein L21e [Thermoprotei archaeon]RLF16607.1 MAG: 50S ribosomal protein L21e [Thermoprotei archaeon]
MGPKSKGLRCRSRKKLSKHPREKGMRGLSRLLQDYEVGQKVSIHIDPTRIETAPHGRFQGLTGTIIGRRGSAYIVEVYLGDKRKTVITEADHLKPLTST